jgi:predicted HicB family RNase H-like nuclease
MPEALGPTEQAKQNFLPDRNHLQSNSHAVFIALTIAHHNLPETVDGYHAKIEYDEDLDLFRGEILGLSGGADFYGKNPKELRTELKKSLEVFLEVCKEKGLEPRRHFSGKFNLRISPELHERLAIEARVASMVPGARTLA